MFVFKPTTKTYSDPVSATFTPGIPFGREKSKGDICLLHEGFAASKIFLNSSVLREAILNSKDFLEEVLSIKITDKVGKEPVKVKVDTKDLEIYEPEANPEDLKFPEIPKDGMLEEEDLKVTGETVTVEAKDLNITAEEVESSTVTMKEPDAITETGTESKPEKETKPAKKSTKK